MMKNNILYWIGTDFTPYCIAYGLQNKLESNNFAIIDNTNKPKNFFETQKLVPFSKIWFLHDHLNSNLEPDIEYLKKMEEKYDLNLWKLAINERIFYRFYNFHKFSTNEILSIEESSLRFFESILDSVSPTHIVTKVPAFHHLELFTHICKKRGIDVLIFGQTNLAKKCIISNEAAKFDLPFHCDPNNIEEVTFEDLQRRYDSSKLTNQIKNSNEKHGGTDSDFIKSTLEFLSSSNNHINSHYNYYGRTKLKVFQYMLSSIILKKLRKNFIDRNLSKDTKFNSPFLYFPLAVDLERNLLINAPFFTNQTELIRTTAKSLPVGYSLVVKENPGQVAREWRSISEYKEIMNIPNVIFLHPEVSSKKILEKCSLVVSIAGSSGFEAGLYGKPSIVFADTFYSDLPSIYRVKIIEDLPNIIKKSLDHNVNPGTINEYLDFIDKMTFDFDLFDFSAIFKNTFYYGGNLHDVHISEEKMKKFLIETENILKPITTEYFKKIQNT